MWHKLLVVGSGVKLLNFTAVDGVLVHGVEHLRGEDPDRHLVLKESNLLIFGDLGQVAEVLLINLTSAILVEE